MKVQLHRRKVKLPSGERQYWTLRWVGTDGRRYSEAIGAVAGPDKLTKKAAEEKRRKKEQDIAGGRVPRNRPKAITLGAFFDLHEEAVKPKVSGATLIEYRIAADHAKAVLGEGMLLERIEVADVARIESHLLTTKRGKRTRSKATVNKTLRALRTMLRRAVEWGYLTSNPVSRYEMPSGGARDARVFSRSEIDEMIAAAGSDDGLDWWQVLIRLAADSGARKSELLHLRWRDVDIPGASVRVEDHRPEAVGIDGQTYTLPGWCVKRPGRNSNPKAIRTVPIPEGTAALLGRFKMRGDRSPFLFLPLRRLAQIQPRLVDGYLPAKFDLWPNMLRDFHAIQNRVKTKRAEAADVQVSEIDWRLGCIHDLRVAFCTHAAKRIPMYVLQEFAGHEDIATTARFYTKTSEEDAMALRAAMAGPPLKLAKGA